VRARRIARKKPSRASEKESALIAPENIARY
jgi:hypothetical protein